MLYKLHKNKINIGDFVDYNKKKNDVKIYSEANKEKLRKQIREALETQFAKNMQTPQSGGGYETHDSYYKNKYIKYKNKYIQLKKIE